MLTSGLMSSHRLDLMISPHDGGSVLRTAEFEQFEAERFDLGQHSVQRRLVGQRPGEHGLPSVCPCAQAWERAEQGFAQQPADPDLVADRPRQFIHVSCPFLFVISTGRALHRPAWLDEPSSCDLDDFCLAVWRPAHMVDRWLHPELDE
jgi:hypothetical protein